MYSSAIVFDLETVPDISGYAAANNLIGCNDEEIREAIGDKFPKHIYHRIICIGAVIAHFESNLWVVDSIGAPSVENRTEHQLIAAFVSRIAQLRPQLITFNGHSFDLPTLRYRAMINGISAPGLSARDYFNRYSSHALDLCDELSSFSPGGKPKLNELSRIMGLPGKPEDIDGKEVEAYFRAGKLQEIANYCETDVANTYRLWLRYELFCGRLNDRSFEESEQNLVDFLRLHSEKKAHLASFILFDAPRATEASI